MTKESYCSYTQCEKLKQLGFDWPTRRHYNIGDGGKYWMTSTRHPTDFNKSDGFSIPTTAVVKRWLREIHNLAIVIDPSRVASLETRYFYSVYSLKDGIVIDANFDTFKTYEDAEMNAIDTTIEIIQKSNSQHYYG